MYSALRQDVIKKFEDHSRVALYGDLSMFATMREQGHTHVAFGVGPWIHRQRIAALWVFTGPDESRIDTIQHPRFADAPRIPGDPVVVCYTPEEFTRFCKRRKIVLKERSALDDLLEQRTP